MCARETFAGFPLRVQSKAANGGPDFCKAKISSTKKERHLYRCLSFLVRAMGLEPTRPYGHKHLKLACLPIPARSRTEYPFIIAKHGGLSRGGAKFAPSCAVRCGVLQLGHDLADGGIHRNGGTKAAAGPSLVDDRQLVSAVILHQPCGGIDHQ